MRNECEFNVAVKRGSLAYCVIKSAMTEERFIKYIPTVSNCCLLGLGWGEWNFRDSFSWITVNMTESIDHVDICLQN